MKRQDNIPEQGGALDYRRSLIAQRLHQLPVLGELHVLTSDQAKYLNLAIDDANHINGAVTPIETGLAGHITYFESSVRRKGLGSRLLQVFTAELVALGATELFSDTNTSAAIRTQARVFGEGCLRFYDIESPDSGTLPLDYAQALATNALIAANRPRGASVFDSPTNIGVYVDLSSVDTANWERAKLTVFEPQTA
jgi:hypothetical protein